MAYVQRISANAKGHRAEVALTPCTMIVGPNKSGKSALIEALSLGLRGRGYAEGLGKRESILRRMIPFGDKSLFSNLVLSDGTALLWECPAGSGKAIWRSLGEGAQVPLPAGILVGEVVQDLLLGSQDRLRHGVLVSCNSVVKIKALVDLIPDVYKDEFREFFARSGVIIDSSIDPDGEIGFQDFLTLRGMLHDDVVRAGKVPQNTALEDMQRESARIEHELSCAKDIIDSGKPDAVDLEKVAYLESAAVVLSFIIAQMQKFNAQRKAQGLKTQDLVKCPCCMSNVEIAKFDEKLTTTAEKIPSAVEKRRLLQEWEAANTLYTKLAPKAALLKVELSALNRNSEGPEEQNRAKMLLQIFDGVTQKELEIQSGIIERRMNIALPKAMRAKLTTDSEDGKPVCRIGLEKDGVVHDFRTLSGAERAVVISALSVALASSSSEEIRCRLLVIDDVWLDPPMIRDLCKALASVVGTSIDQVVLCAAEWRAKTVPDGWSLIRLGAPEAQEAPEVPEVPEAQEAPEAQEKAPERAPEAPEQEMRLDKATGVMVAKKRRGRPPKVRVETPPVTTSTFSVPSDDFFHDAEAPGDIGEAVADLVSEDIPPADAFDIPDATDNLFS